MDCRELIGERILAKLPGSIYNGGKVEELKVLEVSPSGKWVKIMNSDGRKFWKATADVALVEVLKSLEARPEVKPEE